MMGPIVQRLMLSALPACKEPSKDKPDYLVEFARRKQRTDCY
ncbi:MAG TPA: hypothetical protein VGO51_10455 [Burkholderiaceae bacterium]|jgi:hypothetical protein|nr:hypothetical protein [Burkholderiaceae bacterium]